MAPPAARSNLLAPREPLPGIQRIAVLRANGIGDLMFAVPALKALKAAYPAAELVLLAAGWQGKFLAGRGMVDRVIEVPPYPGVRDGEVDEELLSRFFETMASECFDVAIQMHGGGGNSNPFVRRLGARLSVGLRAGDAPPLDLNLPYVYFQPEVARYLELVGLIGAHPVEVEPSLPLLPSDFEEADALLTGMAAPIVILNPGASDPRRRWPVERFAAAGDALASLGCSIAIVGGPEDVELAEAVRGSMRRDALDLAGRLSLRGLLGLLARCDLVVSNDTGPLHLAAAVGTPTLGIYWIGNLINGGPLTRRRHRPLVSFQTACPVCGRSTSKGRCAHDASFVAEVSVPEVVETAMSLLGLTQAED